MEFLQQFERAKALAYRYYQNLVGSRYSVRWISNYQLGNNPPEADSFLERHAEKYPQLGKLEPRQHLFPR